MSDLARCAGRRALGCTKGGECRDVDGSVRVLPRTFLERRRSDDGRVRCCARGHHRARRACDRRTLRRNQYCDRQGDGLPLKPPALSNCFRRGPMAPPSLFDAASRSLSQVNEGVVHPAEGCAAWVANTMNRTRLTVRRSGAPKRERTSAACHASSPEFESIPPHPPPALPNFL